MPGIAFRRYTDPATRSDAIATARKKKKKPAAARSGSWTRWPDERLLDTRFSDLRLTLAGAGLVTEALQKLEHELETRNIVFRPHWWLSDCWFCPDGVPGFAIPFYLAHPRLARLERRQLLEVEGGTEDWCLKILRHEAGHAFDTAYGLHRRKQYRKLFGKYTDPYPEHYYPRPYSKNYVLHLEPSYAQAHPPPLLCAACSCPNCPTVRSRTQPHQGQIAAGGTIYRAIRPEKSDRSCAPLPIFE